MSGAKKERKLHTPKVDRLAQHKRRVAKKAAHLAARKAAGKPERGHARQSPEGLAKRAQKKQRMADANAAT